MSTMTFQINDGSTSTTNPAVWVTITEMENGSLSFAVTQVGGIIGDLRGLFFDVSDESILGSLIVNALSSDIRIGDDSIKDLGDGANMNGLLGSDKGYDVGIEIGTSGIGKDDVRSYSFTLSSSARDLSLSDFSHVDFGARLTSVGVIGGTRADSSKLLENTSEALQLANANASVLENQTVTDNVLNELNLAGSTQVTGWSGGAAGSQVLLESEGDTIGTLRLNADGSYVLDASMADKLSAGESIIYNLNYSAKNQDEATSWSTDNASFTVVVNGVNDGPVANDDIATTTENGLAATGNVLNNDSDIDRLDTIAVVGLAGGNLGEALALTNGAGANFILNANGSYTLDASQANALSAGETIAQSFTYTLADNHGATDTATVNVTVTGVNDGPVANDDDGGALLENALVAGNVLANDSDIDRLDVIKVNAVGDTAMDEDGSISVTLASGAIVTMSADGSYTYNANGAFDSLNDGEIASDSFAYQIDDGHGGTDTASATFLIQGAGSTDTGGGGGGGDQPVDMFPAMLQNISNVVLYLDDGDSSTDILKIKLQPEGLQINDVDNLNIFDFIDGHADVVGNNTQLVGISIHAGQEYPNLAGTDYTAQGEGAFYFLNDGEDPAVEAIGARLAGQWSFDWSNDDIPLTDEAKATGLSNELLAQQAQIVYTDLQNGVWVA